MAVILKQSHPLVLAALIVLTSPDLSDAAAKGIRGRQHEQSNFLDISLDRNMGLSKRELKKAKKTRPRKRARINLKKKNVRT